MNLVKDSSQVIVTNYQQTDEDKALNMIINSYSEQIWDKLELNESQKSEFYSMIK